jgi:hypothetical protein
MNGRFAVTFADPQSAACPVSAWAIGAPRDGHCLTIAPLTLDCLSRHHLPRAAGDPGHLRRATGRLRRPKVA